MENTTGMAARYSQLETLGVRELEQLIKRFPWFSMARTVLLERLAEMGPEYLEQKIKESALYLPSRARVYCRTRKILETAVEPDWEAWTEDLDFNRMRQEAERFGGAGAPAGSAPEAEPLEILSGEPKPRIVVAGGDYFTEKDFAELKEPAPAGPVRPFPRMAAGESSGADGMQRQEGEFFTETLARIYAEQGYYDEAIRVYAKLILLYPEKSAYFALLVNEIKSKI